MDRQNKEMVPKASEQCEFPSSKVTGEGDVTLSGASVIATAVKEGLSPDNGSLVTMSPGISVSERATSARNLFGRQDPGKEKKRRKKKKKASKGGTDGEVSEMVSVGSPTPTSDGSTPRELKKR